MIERMADSGLEDIIGWKRNSVKRNERKLNSVENFFSQIFLGFSVRKLSFS